MANSQIARGYLKWIQPAKLINTDPWVTAKDDQKGQRQKGKTTNMDVS
jgi:hypothetical protein